MLIDIINKILLILFFLSITNVIRHIFFTVLAWSKGIEENGTYIISQRGLFLLGLSIAFIMTSIITGIGL